MPKSGISYMGIEVPPYVVTSKTIAEIEGVQEGKIKEGLMVNEFRFPGYSDTIVTVAANGFMRFLNNLTTNPRLYAQYQKYGIDGFYVATESSDEASKPTSMHVLELVEPVVFRSNGKSAKIKEVSKKLREADSFEAKFACTALAKMVNLVNSSIQNGSMNSAVVMSTDLSLYDDATAKRAQPTQGMAAVLVYLTRDPLLVSIDKRAVHFNLPAFDFYKQGEHTPRVQSGYGSEVDYVINIGSGVKNYEQKFGLPKKFYAEFHVPFPKEAYYLAPHLFVHELRQSGKLSALEAKMGKKEPLGSSANSLDFMLNVVREHNAAQNDGQDVIGFIESHKGLRALWDFHREEVRKTDEFKQFAKQIGLQYSLELPSLIGNTYNGSMFVAKASLLRNLPDEDTDGLAGLLRSATRKMHLTSGPKILNGSYGSGSGTSVWMEEIVEKSQRKRRELIDVSSLDTRVPLSRDEYTALYKGRIEKPDSKMTEDSIALDKSILRDKFVGNGFKFIRFNETKVGEYTFDGQKVKQMPIMV